MVHDNPIFFVVNKFIINSATESFLSFNYIYLNRMAWTSSGRSNPVLIFRT